jgi:Elongation complex protein 6
MALLVSACGFTEPRKFIVIKENHDIEGSFLINSLIGQRLRQQSSGIVLVCCHQTFKYYESCGKKLGYNLSMSVSKNVLQVIEPLRDMTNLTADVLMDRVFKEINEKLSNLTSDGKKSVTVIIDDLSFFTNMGCSESDLITTGIRLNQLAQQTNGLSIVLKIGLSDLNQHLSNNIEDFSDVTLTVEKLKSGDFWDVDGKLTIKKTNLQGDVPVMENERSLLYFIADHNVKLTVPGEFGLKM